MDGWKFDQNHEKTKQKFSLQIKIKNKTFLKCPKRLLVIRDRDEYDANDCYLVENLSKTIKNMKKASKSIKILVRTYFEQPTRLLQGWI